MNAIIILKTILSNLVSFSLSSPLYPQYIIIKNTWVTEELAIPNPNFHCTTCHYNTLIYQVYHSPLLPKKYQTWELHLHFNYKLGRSSESVAIETKLGWVIFWGKQIQKDILSTVISNKTSVTLRGLNENVEKFWEVESYNTLPIDKTKLLPKDEQHVYDILETTT